LAEHGILLSPEAFAEAFYPRKTAAAAIRDSSGNIWKRMSQKPSDPRFSSILEAFDRMSAKSAAIYFPDSYLASFHFSPQDVRKKTCYGSLMSLTPEWKQASFLAESESVQAAEDYAVYRAAALCRFPRHLVEQGMETAVLQTLTPP
jgi:hypothetical protein